MVARLAGSVESFTELVTWLICREQKTHHRAHRDHRENHLRSREQGLQGYGSLFFDPQSLPSPFLRGLCGGILLRLPPRCASVPLWLVHLAFSHVLLPANWQGEYRDARAKPCPEGAGRPCCEGRLSWAGRQGLNVS